MEIVAAEWRVSFHSNAEAIEGSERSEVMLYFGISPTFTI